MVRRILLLLEISLASAFTFLSQAQDLNLKVGYGTYSMADIKNLQEDIISTNPIPFQTTESFPGYLLFSLEYNHSLENWLDIGGSLEYKSTGGRVYYADYSGSAYVDQILTGYSIAASASAYLINNTKWELPVVLRGGVVRTTMDINSQVSIGGQTVQDGLEVASTSVFVEPGIKCVRVFSNILLSVECGYELNFNAPLHLSSNSDATLVNSQGEEIAANWSGLRIRAGLGYRFGQRK